MKKKCTRNIFFDSITKGRVFYRLIHIIVSNYLDKSEDCKIKIWNVRPFIDGKQRCFQLELEEN